MGPIIRQIDFTNAFTLSGLFFSFGVVLFSFHDQFYAAVLCLMFCGLIDLFDGFFAKRLKRSEEAAAAGPALDSLVDVCAFGFAPAVFAYCFGLQGPLSVALLIAFMGVNALRLAYFDRVGLTGNTYTGMPVTYTALLVPLAFTARFFVPDEIVTQILFVLYILMAVAMVSNIPVRKLQGVWYIIFVVGAVVLTVIYVRAILMVLE